MQRAPSFEIFIKTAISNLAFSISTVSENLVRNELKSINPQKSTGLDNISPKFLKNGCNELANPLTYVINLSISTSSVPGNLKAAKVSSSLYKKNGKLKILEKCVHSQMQSYFKEKYLIYQFQSGFR